MPSWIWGSHPALRENCAIRQCVTASPVQGPEKQANGRNKGHAYKMSNIKIPGFDQGRKRAPETLSSD
jgi:hypothetical protein